MDYRRMGNVEQQSRNASSSTFLHQLRDLWRNPRGTVLRIEALALVAIALSFFIAAFGSCRRWSNHWVVQKGFLIANALSLSLGTYSIGLMQSSSVKSEIYPVWAVSLLSLLCCVDTATIYNLDSNSQLWKMLYQLCLYCGYVLLMSISTISSDIGNIAICVLSAITLMKGFHRSMALMLPRTMRSTIGYLEPTRMQVDLLPRGGRGGATVPNIDEAISSCKDDGLRSALSTCRDACFSFAQCHWLQQRFQGISKSLSMKTGGSLVVNYDKAFKVVEVELAFLYDVFFTNNAFLHFYEAKTTSIWAIASILGICFVGVAATIPGAARLIRSRSPPGTIVLDTTTGDLVTTGVILVSLALMQALQLICCWTSNWARVDFACEYAKEDDRGSSGRWWMRLRACLIKINWFDSYLWQNKIGQHSLVDASSTGCGSLFLGKFMGCLLSRCYPVSRMLGLPYIGIQVFGVLRGRKKGNAIELHADVQAAIGDFVCKMRRDEVTVWASSFIAMAKGQSVVPGFHPYFLERGSFADNYSDCIMMWHIATWYCELRHESKKRAAMEKDHRVATALSRYCMYLVVSAPRLLPGSSGEISEIKLYNVEEAAGRVMQGAKETLAAIELEDQQRPMSLSSCYNIFRLGVFLGKRLHRDKPEASERWKFLAEFWVQALVHAAPLGDMEEHIRHLSLGGQLITHLWAMLYNTGIRNWEGENQKDAADARLGARRRRASWSPPPVARRHSPI